MRPGSESIGSAAYIAVIGSTVATDQQARIAEAVGAEIAHAGAVLVCGGLGGVMEAACKGAKSAGGTTLGILPGHDRRDANKFVDLIVATGIGESRNAVIVATADGLIAVGGEYGTLSEIALGLRAGKPVVGLATWELKRPTGDAFADSGAEGIVTASDPHDAVQTVLRLTGS